MNDVTDIILGYGSNRFKDIALIKPKKPIVKCNYDNCNGNKHENPKTREPYPCPNESPDF